MNMYNIISESDEIMNNDAIHLYIKNYMGQCDLITVNKSISIYDLKKEICENLKSITATTDSFDILYNNNIRLNTGYLDDYNVNNYSTLTLIPSMKTGSGFYKTFTPLSRLISKDDIKSELNKYLFGSEDLSGYLNKMVIHDSSDNTNTNDISNTENVDFLTKYDENRYYEFIEKMNKIQIDTLKRSNENSRIQERLTDLYYKMKRNKKTISAIKERYKNKDSNKKLSTRGYMGLKKGFLLS